MSSKWQVSLCHGYGSMTINFGVPRQALQSTRFKAHRKHLQRLLVKFSLKHGILPASLFLSGVKLFGDECHSMGSFADIYIGDLGGTKVALKRLRMFSMIEESKRAQLRRSFHHESLIWRGLSHPHVLSFFGVNDTAFKRSPCMVSPWMELGNIRSAADHLRQSLPAQAMVTQTLTWIQQITSGLAYLHSEEIVHGDLRGPNILVDSDKMIKLADFGLAVFAEGASRNYGSTRGGNARWLSPELIHPELFGLSSDRPTYSSDVFALGCVCVEICTSQAPYAGISDHQVIARVPYGLRPARPNFPDNTDLPDALWSTIMLCWTHTAVERPTALSLVETTKACITRRELTPPLDDNVLSHDAVAAAADNVLGERIVESTVHAWAGDRSDWQEYLQERKRAKSGSSPQWSRSHPGQNDAIL
ncbi:hypothetical protein EIP91_004676 [Steccherinum ochraceum]|uniref:Protein kinase domain-containing protein n=1 Tax=Steccherinum ochraceum TaxID=92696 RepID=A0A4R0RJP9_9APHY|nr:hypothetical protein EIP91_004676 [Steccherinum ochraceum]